MFHRLNVFPVQLPPLRERREDIPLLASHFRLRGARENGVEPPEITPETLHRMTSYDWPGNVRELENAIERAVILHARAQRWSLERLEREYILAILEQTRGHQVNAAEILGSTGAPCTAS